MRRLVVPALAFTLLLAGCSSTTGAPPVSSTSTPSSSPVPATPSAFPSVSPEPSTAPSSEYGAFGSRDALVSTCIALEAEKVGSQYLTFHTDQALVERRAVLPEWLVYIPALNDNGDVMLHCIFGGSPEDIDLMTVGGVLPLSEEEIQRDIASNDRFMR